MKTKEEVIKEAWGLAYDEVKHLLTDNGYIRSVDLAHIRLNLSSYNLDLNYNNIGARPKTLQGIENNRGWIIIESEDDLPKDFCDVWVLNSFGDIEQTEFNADYKRFHGYFSERNDGKVTHYHPIIKPLKPLY